MDIVKDYPPNYREILASGLKPPDNAVFCYGNKIYNPSGKEIPADTIYHESIHFEQQGKSPDLWWIKYCYDQEFRQEMEIDAYARQWNYIKLHIPKASQDALDDFSDSLASPMYGLLISNHQAKTLIRLKAKEYGTTI